MRIVAGTARGRRLEVPATGTRPTSDRAREAMFNTLAGLLDLPGARVLDLFAGTGALGLEALSRGAGEAVFVESDRRARAVLARNITAVGLPGATVVPSAVHSYLADAAPSPYDLVVADPPYAMDAEVVAAWLAVLDERGWLQSAAVLVVERPSRDAAPLPWPAEITPLRRRRYGEGELWYGRRP